MALSRHQRRKIARQRQLAKAVRVYNAIQTREREARQAIVRDNLNSPKPSRFADGRGLYRSCLAGIEATSHKGLLASPNSKTDIVSRNEARPRLYSVDDRGRVR